MNVNEIFQGAVQASQTLWNCVASMGGLLPPEWVCSMTVNIAILALILLGAVRLVFPSGEK